MSTDANSATAVVPKKSCCGSSKCPHKWMWSLATAAAVGYGLCVLTRWHCCKKRGGSGCPFGGSSSASACGAGAAEASPHGGCPAMRCPGLRKCCPALNGSAHGGAAAAAAAAPEHPQAVVAAGAPVAMGPYSHAIRNGNTVYVCGCLGLNPETNELAGADVVSQARQSLRNLQTIVEASGSSLDRVLKVTVLLRDMADYASVNAVYTEFFPASRPAPARTCFAVLGLPRDARVEIECIAAV